MKKVWLVEKYIFSDYEKELADTIKSYGFDCHVFDDTDRNFDFNKTIKNKYNENDCVIFYGSLQVGRQIYNRTNLIPGVFLNIDNYDCNKYYGYYGNELVNNDYLFFGLNDIKRNINKIFEYFKTTNIFIRPSNGYKSFTGQLISKDNFNSEFEILCKSYGGLDLNQLVLVSSQKKILEESRFIIFNKNNKNEIIDGNKYMINGELVKNRILDQKALEYVHKIKDMYTPDKAFTIDIAKLEDNTYKILEIGSFCCASWYNADIDKIVKETNNLIIEEYNDYWNLSK